MFTNIRLPNYRSIPLYGIILVRLSKNNATSSYNSKIQVNNQANWLVYLNNVLMDFDIVANYVICKHICINVNNTIQTKNIYLICKGSNM